MLPRERQQGGQGSARGVPTDRHSTQFSASRVKDTGTGTKCPPNVAPDPLLSRAAGIQAQDAEAGAGTKVVSYSRWNTTYVGKDELGVGPFDMKVLASNQYVDNSGNCDPDGQQQLPGRVRCPANLRGCTSRRDAVPLQGEKQENRAAGVRWRRFQPLIRAALQSGLLAPASPPRSGCRQGHRH